MSARSSARYVGMLLVTGIAPGAGAVDAIPGQTGSPPHIATAVSLPAFIDASRLADMQAAWRTHFGGRDIVVAAPVASTVSDPEAGTINEARQTLTRAEQVTIEAAAVRERAEQLSRRFAVDTAAESAVAANAGPAPASPESVVTETVAVSAEAAPASEAVATTEEAAPTAPALIQKAVATATVTPKADMGSVSMLGGPPVDEAPARAAAPVIEDMATARPPAPAKRTVANPQAARRSAQAASASEPPTLYGIFSSWGSSGEEAAAKPAEKSVEPSTPSGLPTEIRSFGWTQ
jgi:hypothetical protein